MKTTKKIMLTLLLGIFICVSVMIFPRGQKNDQLDAYAEDKLAKSEGIMIYQIDFDGGFYKTSSLVSSAENCSSISANKLDNYKDLELDVNGTKYMCKVLSSVDTTQLIDDFENKTKTQAMDEESFLDQLMKDGTMVFYQANQASTGSIAEDFIQVEDAGETCIRLKE